MEWGEGCDASLVGSSTDNSQNSPMETATVSSMEHLSDTNSDTVTQARKPV